MILQFNQPVIRVANPEYNLSETISLAEQHFFIFLFQIAELEAILSHQKYAKTLLRQSPNAIKIPASRRNRKKRGRRGRDAQNKVIQGHPVSCDVTALSV